jgi:hypothetical protein
MRSAGACPAIKLAVVIVQMVLNMLASLHRKRFLIEGKTKPAAPDRSTVRW